MVKDNLLLKLKAIGYGKILFADTEQGFIAVSKQETLTSSFLAGDPNASLIFVKFTDAHDGKIRIDLVNAASNVFIKQSVDDDIAELAAAIPS